MAAGPTPVLKAIVALGKPPKSCPLQGLAQNVFSAADKDQALRAVQEAAPDLVIIRETASQAEGLALLEDLRRTLPGCPVVVVSERGDVDEAVRFMRQGARDYVRGPVDDAALKRILAAARPEGAEAGCERFFSPCCPAGVPIVGHSEAIRRTLQTLRLVADSRCDPVLIIGETGTGKELAAQAVHRLRGGTAETFVAVNCATLTANLLESELFGHVRGAFTGADREKTGLFELAGAGSIFLDEISEMPLNLQAKLLRVFQEKQFRKVGGTKDIPCRATIIASSNRDLAADAKENRFRSDLYHRLAVFPVMLPPLRWPQRRDDIPLLAEYFIRTCTLPVSGRIRGLTAAAEEILLGHAWPGNVRELRNVVERAMILEPSDRITAESLLIETGALAGGAGTPLQVPDNDFSLETAERLFITRALQETDWQRTRAAALLGITRATLHAKLKRYKIKLPTDGAAASDADVRGPSASRFEEACV